MAPTRGRTRQTNAAKADQFAAQDENSLPWEKLRSRFLDSKSAAERARILHLSSEMVPELDTWAQQYPLIRRVRIWPLSMSVAAAAPFSSVEALVATAKVSLWVFTLDDVFDEELLEEEDLMRRVESYREIAHGAADGVKGDSLGTALCDVRDGLGRFSVFDSLAGEWGDALRGTIDGMIRENCWRVSSQCEGFSTLPTYEEYVANGLYSIGGPPHVWAAIITADDASSAQHLDHLRKMEHIASTCVRLANDLQSHEKEMSEGKINSLVILAKTFEKTGASVPQALVKAEETVVRDIANGIALLGELQMSAVTDTGRPEAAIADIARFVCEFYTHHDYHTFTQQR